MARASIDVKIHACTLFEMDFDKAFLPNKSNGGQPRIPMPILKVTSNSWEFPIGDIVIPVRYCPYCGDKLDG